MTDLAAHIEVVARALLGAPNKQLSTRSQLRFGTNGSVAVEIAGPDRGTWYDHEAKTGGATLDLVRHKLGIANGAALDWLRSEIGIGEERQERRRSAHERQRIVATYDYYDEQNNPVFRVNRWGPHKTFTQSKADGKGGWISGKGCMEGVRLVPYRLPELLASPDQTVFIPEGEKDVDRLRAVGLIATCNPGGAGKWQSGFAQSFHGRRVVILPDNDKAGRDHSRQVAVNLARVAADLRVVELPGLPDKGDVSDWLDAGGTLEGLERLVADAPLHEAKENTDDNGLRLVRFDDMQLQTGGGYLVKNLLGSTSMTVIYGEAGTGKTFFALWLAMCIAAGWEFFGRRVARGAILYVAAEAGRSIENRTAAAKHEIEFPELMPFAAITSPIDLCSNDADLGRLVSLIRATDLGMPLSMIVIDTLSRVLAGGNENAPDDMGALVRNLDRLRDETGAAIVLVHHSGKDAARGARGHSLLRAATDTEIEVCRDEGTKVSTARVTKQRDLPTEGSFAFTLRQVELGVDADGDPVTSCIVEEAEGGTAPKAARDRLPASQRRALQLLTDAIERGGEMPPASNHIPAGARCVPEKLWREYCYQGAISAGEQNAKRMAFNRAAEALVAAGRVGKWEPWVWLA